MTAALLPTLAFLAATSRVASVVVYPDRAQVTRTAAVACGPRATATFEGLPPSVDPTTFRARTDAGTVEGLRAEEHPLAQAFAAQREDLDERLRKLDLEITAQGDARARSASLARLGNQYSEVASAMVARELAQPRPDVKAWASAFDAALATRLKAAAEAGVAAAKLRELSRQREDLARKQARLGISAQRREYGVEVQVSCPAGQEAQVELSYLVGGASWEPTYEARADEAGGTVELATFATVSQSTGENWSRARLALSTALPRQSATPPELRRLEVSAEKREAEKKVLVRRDEYQEHAEAGEATAATGGEGGLTAAPQGLSVQLQVPEAADVPGDGRPARLFVARDRMKAIFAYRAVPKLMPFVFRVADLANTGAFPLLAGPLDAFGRSGFIARYPLERVAQGGRFHLTFGIEEGLRVKRVVVDEVQRDAGLFNSARRYHYAYRFELANYQPRPEEVELSEPVPVSELDDVKVELEPKTTPGYELKAQDGIATWKVKLAPQQQKALELGFHVDVPASYEAGGP